MTTFSNYAGVPNIDSALISELNAAGIEPISHPVFRGGEVDTSIRGQLHGWSFTRRWYYWAAEGPGLPPVYAEELYRTNQIDVRVNGHCGCPSPYEQEQGFAIGLYHIDTPEGLRAFADTLKRCVLDAKLSHELLEKTNKDLKGKKQ